MQKVFFETLEEKNKNGATIFFSSHILTEIQKICNRVAIIKAGKIIKVETVDAIKDSNYKRFRVESPSDELKKIFSIEGITNFKHEDSSIAFIYNGNMNVVLSALSKIDVKNLIIEEPTLEEIFIHYYQ